MATLNRFTFTAIQFLLNPTQGKSAQFVPVVSARTRNRFHAPVGSLVCETPIMIEDVALWALERATAIQRCWTGS